MTVVSTPDVRRIPSADGGRPWRWWCPRAPTTARACEAVANRAYDVMVATAPTTPERLLRRIVELLIPEEPTLPDEFSATQSAAAKLALTQLRRAAQTSMPVLITGETGSGKEVSARLLHTWSRRAARPFVPINCAAIPNERMEAELFGYAKGAFSGAVARFDGRLTSAEGGTVFLDEIDDTPLSTQVKLLRAL